MSDRLAAAELFVLAFAACALVSRGVFSLFASRAIEAVKAWEPARRHVALLLLSGAPWLLTCTLFLAVLSPSIVALVWPAFDHCLVHDDGHAHLCFVHLPRHAPHVAIWAALTFLVTLGVAEGGAALLRMGASQRMARALVHTTHLGRDGIRIVEGDLTFCATVGLLRPAIVVSGSLLKALPESERRALLSHEQAHVRRRDALTHALASTLSWMYPRATRARLERALDLAAEQACDEAAAKDVGDRLTVADAIVRTERALSSSPAAGLVGVAVGMGQIAIEQRVEALLNPPKVRSRLGAVLAFSIACACLIFLAADSLHHGVESLLSPTLQ